LWQSRGRRLRKYRAYQLGWLALKFAGHPERDAEDFFREELGLDVSLDTVQRAVDRVAERGEFKEPPGPRPSSPSEEDDAEAVDPAIWPDWPRVAEKNLGLRKVLVEIRTDGREDDNLVDAIATLRGVRHVVQVRHDRKIFALAVLRTEAEEEDLRARVLEHAPGLGVTISVILKESVGPDAWTWLHLAKEAAAELDS
jgi:hypothetical protein